MTSTTLPKKPMWIWLLWLAGFYATWLWLIVYQDGWTHALAHWPIALAMAVGGYAAGSTPMGGGTVGFPVLVLGFDMPATLGRDFSFAVQSIGMVSASIFILVRRQPLAWNLLKGAMVGSLVGTPAGILLVGPIVPELWIKVVFAVIWASFGVLHFYRMREIASHHALTGFSRSWDFRTGLAIGLTAGATVSAVTGVGIDMVVYTVLVLLCRVDLRVAIPTSIVIMAFTSLVGMATKSLTTGFQPGVYENWLAAAPVVALVAPLGVLMVSVVGRRPILMVVATLCVGQFLWTCYAEWDSLGIGGIALACTALGICLLVFERLRTIGILLASVRRKPPTSAAAETPAP